MSRSLLEPNGALKWIDVGAPSGVGAAGPLLRGDPSGLPLPDLSAGIDVYLEHDTFDDVFVQDVTARTASAIAATQRPIAPTILEVRSGAGVRARSAPGREIPMSTFFAGIIRLAG